MYIGHLFKRFVIGGRSLVSVESKVAIVIIFALIMEADLVDIVFMVTYRNRSLI